MTFFQKKLLVTEEDIQRLLRIFKKIPKSNVWSKVEKGDFLTERFEGGYVNDICGCTLTEEAQKRFAGNCSPLGVVVKMFHRESIAYENIVHFTTVCSMIADNGLGAKLLYIDDECCVNEYIVGSRHYNLDDDNDKEFNKTVMQLLARYHTLKVPVPYQVEKWVDKFNKLIADFPGSKEGFSGEYLEFMKEIPELKDLADDFATMDFKHHHEYFTKAQFDAGSPIVFAHLDFQRHNRLVSETVLPSGETKKELFFIDLDSAIYAFRGCDFSAFFDSLYQKEPHFLRETFASDDVILQFIEYYRQECARIVGPEYLEQEINSPEYMLQEVKFFVLNYSWLLAFFAVALFCQNPKDEKNIQGMIGTHGRIVLFKKLYKRFSEEGILSQNGLKKE